jgi:DNA-binding PadR family transcriptional regulator
MVTNHNDRKLRPLSWLEEAILQVLSNNRPSYGAAIKAVIEGASKNERAIPENRIYAVVNRLKEDGRIKDASIETVEKKVGAGSRKFIEITSAGLAALQKAKESRELLQTESEPKVRFLSPLDEVILQVLSNMPSSYGTEIKQIIKIASGNRIDVSEGGLYPCIKRLKKNGLVIDSVIKTVEEEGADSRKFLEITPAGCEVLTWFKGFRERLQADNGSTPS